MALQPRGISQEYPGLKAVIFVFEKSPGWMDVKAISRIALSNEKVQHIQPCSKNYIIASQYKIGIKCHRGHSCHPSAISTVFPSP